MKVKLWQTMFSAVKNKPRRRMAEGPANGSVRLSVLSAVNALYQNYARAPEKIQKGAEEIKRAHRCWVFVKQFSRNDTATACQDWLRVPG